MRRVRPIITAYWRLAIGPMLTIATAGTLLLLIRSGIQVPAPGAFILAAIFLASYIGGASVGYLSAVIGIGASLVLLPEPEQFISFAFDRSLRIAFLAALALALPILVSRSQARAAERLGHERATRQRVEAANRELLILRADLVRHAEELERLATTDDLTGLCNRRHFLALAEDERRRHERKHRPLALLILDIDVFKSINDRFGHDVGDAVICHVARICREEIRPFDILARIGGEEFVLLLPETTPEQAMMLAERVRQHLEATPFVVDGADVTVTASIGVSEGTQSEGIGDLMKRADQALYQAKREGRNRVKLARRTSQHFTGAAIAAPAVAA
jgi:diguanylate cyclase (GGDEF)-like protein